MKITDVIKVIIGIIILIGILCFYRRCIDKTKPRSKSYTNKEEYCYELLTNTKKLLDDNNIDFFLDYGTLLGAYRDNQFIPHDTDIDISIYDYEKMNTIMNTTNLKKYNLRSSGRVGRDDIHSLKLINFKGKSITSEMKYIDIYKVYFKPKTELYKFYNTKFNIPTNAEKYLEHMYGDTWRTPIKGKHGKWPTSSKTIKNTEWFKDNVIEHKLN